jgi:hypothetical protein
MPAEAVGADGQLRDRGAGGDVLAGGGQPTAQQRPGREVPGRDAQPGQQRGDRLIDKLAELGRSA